MPIPTAFKLNRKSFVNANSCFLPSAICFISLISPTAHAAYKCTVDGKVTYQDAPCAEDIKHKGGQSVVAPPSRRADLIGDLPTATVTKAENDRRKGTVNSELEPLARNAFSAYKDGKMMEYRDMACLDLRRSLTKPEHLQMLKREAADYAERKIELGKLEPIDVAEFLTFRATEVKDARKTWHRPPEQLFVNILLRFEQGKPCVTGVSTYAKEIR